MKEGEVEYKLQGIQKWNIWGVPSMSRLHYLIYSIFFVVTRGDFNNNVQQQQQCGGSPNIIFVKKKGNTEPWQPSA